MRRYLFPTFERDEPRFRAEVARLSTIGLRAIGAICLAAPMIMFGLGTLWLPSYPDVSAAWADLLFVAMGITFVSLSFVSSLRPHARLLGMVAGFLSATLQTLGMQATAEFHRAALHTTPEQHFPFTLATILLVGLAALPLKPLQNFALGCAILAVFAATVYAANGAVALVGWAAFPFLLSLMLLLITTGLTAVLYHQRAFAFLARVRAEESFEAMKKAQASLLLERNAASQTRFAAAMSHELGSPLGALASTFETLARIVESSLDKDSRRARAVSEAIASGRSSYERLTQLVDRMRSLTNLDRADVQVMDINTLCRDTVAFLESELAPVRVELNLTPMPPLRCRPQQLGAVLANLLRNAAAAVEPGGTVELRSVALHGSIVIEVRDNGRGIEPERLQRLFEPEFRVEHDRVTTSNWGLFVSRAIASEHRGRLELESEPGRGTTARLLLPVAA